jgi:hypothetical protein
VIVHPANVHPARSRQRYLSHLIAQLDDSMTDLAALTSAGVLGAEVDELDRVSAGPSHLNGAHGGR